MYYFVWLCSPTQTPKYSFNSMFFFLHLILLSAALLPTSLQLHYQHPLLPTHNPAFIPQTPSPRPYTPEWISALEKLRNSLGGEDDGECPIEIPPFDCFKEEGGEGGADVWHLRPQVRNRD